MAVAYLILFVIAFACFLAAAGNVAARVNLVAAGLACWVLVYVLQYLLVLTR